MTWHDAQEPNCEELTSCKLVKMVITPKEREMGGFTVRRVLPVAACRNVGPFVFFDQMGPVNFPAGKGIEVRPHPHIGLSTLTWLVEGMITHRDSLGYLQDIKPGEVNWMTAGSGIVHSERMPEAFKDQAHDLFGLQVWLALPKEHAETEPSFTHISAADVPKIDRDGAECTLIAGEAWQAKSPVKVFSDTIYLDVRCTQGHEMTLPTKNNGQDHDEMAVYILKGALEIGEETYQGGQMMVLNVDTVPVLTATEECHYVLVGGEKLDGPRHMWWNFVSHDKDRLEQAKQDWKDGNFAAVPGEDDFIPLPE